MAVKTFTSTEMSGQEPFSLTPFKTRNTKNVSAVMLYILFQLCCFNDFVLCVVSRIFPIIVDSIVICLFSNTLEESGYIDLSYKPNK